MGDLAVFVGITMLMLIVPGPDFVLVTRNALAGSRSRAYSTVAGICAGLAFLTVLTAGGVAALVAANEAMLTILRVAGGVYLVLLGALLWRSAWRRPPVTAPSPDGRARSPVVQGFLNNVLNPKALIFYLTFMPQFVVRGVPVFVQTLAMGFVVVLCAAVWWTVYVTALGYLSTAMRRGPVRAVVDAVSGSALAALGVVFVLS